MTSMQAMAAAAGRLGGIDPADPDAVQEYFASDFSHVPTEVRDLVFGWLLQAPAAPSASELDALEAEVRRLLPAPPTEAHATLLAPQNSAVRLAAREAF